MSLELKQALSCILCSLILMHPIKLPCECLCCHVHLRDHFTKDNKIKCVKCNVEHQISSERFPPANETILSKISQELFLTEEEKTSKKWDQILLDDYEKKTDILLDTARTFDFFNDKHFGELRYQLDLHIEDLRLKGQVDNNINEQYFEMIKRTKEFERSFNQSLADLHLTKVDFAS